MSNFQQYFDELQPFKAEEIKNYDSYTPSALTRVSNINVNKLNKQLNYTDLFFKLHKAKIYNDETTELLDSNEFKSKSLNLDQIQDITVQNTTITATTFDKETTTIIERVKALKEETRRINSMRQLFQKTYKL